MEVEYTQKMRKNPSTTSTIWRTLLGAFTIDFPAFFNPMLDTLDPKSLELIETFPAQPIYDNKSLEMALLHVKDDQKDIHHRISK